MTPKCDQDSNLPFPSEDGLVSSTNTQSSADISSSLQLFSQRHSLTRLAPRALGSGKNATVLGNSPTASDLPMTAVANTNPPRFDRVYYKHRSHNRAEMMRESLRMGKRHGSDGVWLSVSSVVAVFGVLIDTFDSRLSLN